MPAEQDFWDRIASLTFENEAAVETRLILPLLRALGYSEAEDIVPKYPVIFQEGRMGRKPEADFVVFGGKPYSRVTSLIAVEAKPPSEALVGGKAQGESYAANLRTPLLIVTNGVNFEVWQLQPSTESELVIDCAVPDLANSRGEIESLLVKDAVVAYARSLQHKSFGLLARDLGPYERAEFDRTDGLGLSIPRKLRGMGPNEGEVSSSEILDRVPGGAVLVGASGYGKTTLAQELRRQAIERRWSNEGQKLPVEVFLPDIPPDRDGLEVYLCARVTAHCPQVTATAFRNILRRDGVTILGDAFDRVPSERRPQTESALVNFRRDYPKTQLFLFTGPSSHPERFALATFRLHELSDEEQYDLVERFSRLEFLSGPSFWHNATSFLRAICRHPLLLQLTLALYKESGRLPTSIELLFRSWLERLIPTSIPIGRKSDLERLLTSVSNASAFRPITVDEAVTLVRGQGFSDDLLQLLIEADALIQRGRTIELQHEALADYLRALDVVWRTPPDAVEHLKSLSLRRGTQLPALLMVTAPNAEMQRLVWAQIVTTDITSAITALRYRADTSSDYEAAGAEEMLRWYLSEIMEGLELPLEVHFKRLAPRIRFGLVGENVDRLGIAGALSADGSRATYSFTAPAGGEEPVVVGPADNKHPIYGKSLEQMGLRLDSGRLVGMGHLREMLLELIKERQLVGGPVWAEERTLGRLRHLARRCGSSLPSKVDLAEIRQHLASGTGFWVQPGAMQPGQTFEIGELVADIDLLIERGCTEIEPWWADADSVDPRTPEGQARQSQILDLHFRRMQLAYKEVVETSFPLIADKFLLCPIMLLRYEIEVVTHNRQEYDWPIMHWRWLPVATLDESGASVSFPPQPSNTNSRTFVDEHSKRIDEALARLGRAASEEWYRWGHSMLPDFEGDHPSHTGQVDETSVIREAAEHLERDIKKSFIELPRNDQGENYFD